MAAVDQLNSLTTKVAEKLNALNTNIGGLAAKGVSTDGGNLLENGSDERPYFDGSSLTIGISSDANNDLTLGSDDKPYLSGEKYVPQLRTLTAGQGINTIGDLSADRTISLDYNYLDNRYNQAYKQRGAARVATESNVALSGLQTIDGITLVAGDRVLLLGQTNPAENGVYVAASGAWTRATDFDEPILSEVAQGAAVFVQEGVNLGGTGWTLRSEPPYVIGTTPLEFDQYAGTTSYVSGDLINIDGNEINHDTGSWVAKSNLSGAAVISNLSVDAYGHPTNWVTRNLTAGNIGAEPSFSKNTAFNKNFGTSSGTVAQGNDSRINNGQTAYSWGNHASAGYVTLSGSETITSWKKIVPTDISADNDAGVITIGASTSLPFISMGNATSDGYSLLLRSYAQSGVQLELNEGGISANGIITATGGDSTDWNTAFGWGNHANAGYITGSYTGFDSRYVNLSGDIITGELRVNPNITGGASSGPKQIQLGATSNGSFISSGTNAGGSVSYVLRGYQSNGVQMTLNEGALSAQGQIAVRAVGTGTGTANLARVGFFESNGTVEQGYIGFASSTRSDLNIRNFIGNTYLQLREEGGVDGLMYIHGGNVFETVYHSGNLTLSTLGGEPAFSKNTAFNKNFGTASGTVAEGNHTHPASAITSETFANARISQSSVTQHNSAINAGRVDGFHFWSGTQAEYDAIGTKDSNTFYIIE